jgi:hypothetical protein
MNENDFSRKICARLDRAPVSAHAEKRLAKAREAALNAARFQTESALALAGHRAASFWRQHPAAGLGLIALLAALLLGASWQWQRQRAAEIDAQLLADELPIEAFLTDRFDAGGQP